MISNNITPTTDDTLPPEIIAPISDTTVKGPATTESLLGDIGGQTDGDLVEKAEDLFKKHTGFDIDLNGNEPELQERP